jgi:hypothetical protein
MKIEMIYLAHCYTRISSKSKYIKKSQIVYTELNILPEKNTQTEVKSKQHIKVYFTCTG